MKYLEHLGLEHISSVLNTTEFSGGVSLHGRVEIYSTKKSVDDKKHSKFLESKFANADALSNPSTPTVIPKEISSGPSASAAVDTSPDKQNLTPSELEAKKTRRMLVDLIQTLNAAQLDHDFSELSHESFERVTISEAMNFINNYLAEVQVKQPLFITSLWKEIDNALSNTLCSCEVYKLADESYSEDLEEGITSSFHYFFCNKDLKRLCYFTCHTTCKYRKYSNGSFGSGDDDEEMDVDQREEHSSREEEESYDWNRPV